MQSTGIVRRLDSLGRITLPMELRKSFDIGDREPLEIFTEDEFQITYYLNHRLEGKPHIIQPRYLLGKYGAEGLLFKPISFDVYLTESNIDDL